MAAISLKNINKSFGDTQVIKNLDLEIKDGEFMVFVGPSGCGKSTVLRMIAGLETVTQGELRIGKQLMNNVHPKDRDIAMVFQSYALYPHMTVFDNIAFGLKIRKIHDDEIKRRVNEASDILGLTPLLERKPKALSGGQRQRVALGRAIVRNPSVFLFDEPLSNLDAELRVQMRAEISKLQRSLKTTTVYVTHDQVEAMTMGHRIAVMRAIGSDTHITTNLTQCGTPLEIYDRPENIFTARFIGTPHMNMIEASISQDGLQVETDGLTLPIGEEFAQAAKRIPGRKVMLGIRPEHIGLPDESDWDNTQPISGKVEMVEPLGHEVIVHFRVGEKMLQGRLRSHRLLPAFGDDINMQVKCNNIHLFDLASEQRIGLTEKP